MTAKNAAKAAKSRRGRRPKHSAFKRVLVGIRVQENIGKLLRALAILEGVPVGEFVEQLLLAAIEGENALADASGEIPLEIKKKIKALKLAYDITFDRHQLLSERSAKPEQKAEE
ncbi:MAG: hypothetical protein ACP5UB_11145 [Candidatus Sumerlaeaceae bacterium]